LFGGTLSKWRKRIASQAEIDAERSRISSKPNRRQNKRLVCVNEAGRQLAAGIPSAHFIALPGRNHLFLEHEPACVRFFEETSLFLKG
jgi:hypothetical protein